MDADDLERARLRERVAILKRALRRAAFRFDLLATFTDEEETQQYAMQWAKDARERAKG